MNSKSDFVRTAGIIFSLVALTHLWIISTNSNISISGNEIGIWINWVAFIITGYMAIQSFKLKS